MFNFLQTASALRGKLLDTLPPLSLPKSINDIPFTGTSPTVIGNDDDANLKDLDFDYSDSESEFDETDPQTAVALRPPSGKFESYDWAFSFREASKSQDKLVLEVSVERVPKSPTDSTHTLQPTTCENSEMVLVVPGNRGMETEDMISEEEQNMIMAAIIASQSDDFNQQIPRHVRDEMEHAEMIAALEASKEMDLEYSQRREEEAELARLRAEAEAEALEEQRAVAYAGITHSAPPTPPRAGLVRRESDIPWAQRGEEVPGETAQQQRFREMLQMHAVAAASVANASAGRTGSHISGENDYSWAGH